MPFIKGPVTVLRGGKMIPATKSFEVSEEEVKDFLEKGFEIVNSENSEPELNFGGHNMLPEKEKGEFTGNNEYDFSGSSKTSGTKVLSGGASTGAPKMGGSSTVKKASTVKSSAKASTVKKGE